MQRLRLSSMHGLLPSCLCLQELAELRANVSSLGSQYASADDSQAGPTHVSSDSRSCVCCCYRIIQRANAYCELELSNMKLHTDAVAVNHV